MFDERGVAVADTQTRRKQLSRAAARGACVRVYPGVYVDPTRARDPLTRVWALQCWRPDAVLLGDAAAFLSLWPQRPVRALAIADPHRPSGVTVVGTRIDPEWIVEAGCFRFTEPAFTAAYLAPSDGGALIDDALRLGVPLQRILAAPLDRWPDQALRRAILEASRDEPWSQAERLVHEILRTEKITGWRTNVPVMIDGETHPGDVVFARQRVIIEVDGRSFHSSAAAFERDRRWQNRLVLAGWTVLRFTWDRLVTDRDGVVAEIRQALRRAA